MDATAVAEAIAAVSASIDRALMEGDASAVAGHFTHDAILGESGDEDVVGRDAILAFLERGNAVRAVTHHQLHRQELHLFGDLAVEYGWFDEVKLKPGLLPIHERGRTMTLWRCDPDGAWRIHRLVISELPPVI